MNVQFKLGTIVYLKTDSEQLPRIVTKISILGSSMSDYVITYELSQGDESSEHYTSEIIKTKDTNLKLGIE
tara:strand:- start:1366 stop:1578 length:213 start_codon:yes stop_codon:yes gene_type:complete